MIQSRAIARKSLSLLVILATAAGLYNVMADNTELVEQAKRVGCGSGDCSRIREQRWPWGQEFGFQGPAATVDVSCRRLLILVGPYRCSKR